MQDLLAPSRLEAQGMLDPQRYATAMSEHISGVRDRRLELWNALMFQAWVDSNHGAGVPPGLSNGQHRPMPSSATVAAGGPEAAALITRSEE
jgi:hypothetical protein